jgi:hypothetical protein
MRVIDLAAAVLTFTVLAIGIASCDGSGPGAGPGGCSVDGKACSVACDDEVGCAACSGDGDCGAAAPFCIAGACKVCDSSSDCATGQACYPRRHECKPACTSGAACDKDEPLCDPDSGACVGCLNDDSCGGSEPICNPLTRRCGECAQSSDCGAARPVCDVDEGRCRECLVDGHCDDGICHDRQCKLVCDDDGDCSDPGRPRCRENSGECVACLVAADCPAAAPQCNPAGRCVSCLADVDCTTPGFPVCDGDERCVACTEDVHCGPGLKCKGKQCRA